MCTMVYDTVDDDDDDISTISGRLKAISDRYLKSSTHRFLAKFYKNSSTKIDKSAETEEPTKDEKKVNKVNNNIAMVIWHVAVDRSLVREGHRFRCSPVLCYNFKFESNDYISLH